MTRAGYLFALLVYNIPTRAFRHDSPLRGLFNYCQIRLIVARAWHLIRVPRGGLAAHAELGPVFPEALESPILSRPRSELVAAVIAGPPSGAEPPGS